MSDMSMPNDHPIVPAAMYDERQVVRLAREIAMNIQDIPDILQSFGLSRDEFERIQKDPQFCKLLAAELSDWQGASNTQERVKIKAAAMIEDFLPELYSRMNDRTEPLIAKAKMLDFIAKMAHLGAQPGDKQLQPGDKVVVQINLGADSKLKYEKRLPTRVIDNDTQQDVQAGLDVGADIV